MRLALVLVCWALCCCLQPALAIAKAAQKKSLSSGAGPTCASECMELNCDNLGIRYGKFCGVGHGGCEGEKPCDAVDACCKGHDECVERAGVMSAPCHRTFIQCIEKHLASGKQGFSKKCPWSQVVPVMTEGIKLTLAFGTAFNKDRDL